MTETRTMTSCKTLSLWHIFLCLLAFLLFPASAEANTGRHILIMHSYHSGMSWVDNLERGIRSGILMPPYENIIIHTEYMDTKRNHGHAYYKRLINIYKAKYHNVDLDLILTTDNNAYDFLLKYRNLLFKDTPVVFGGVNDFTEHSFEKAKNFTGVAEIISFGETVETILRHFPKTKEIHVINDYLTSGRAWYANAIVAQKPYESRVKFTHNDNLTVEELRKSVQSMKPGTVVLLGVFFKDRKGQYLTYEKFGELITEDSPVPVYCLTRFNLRANAIGGKLLSGYHHGRMMSKLGRRILAGEQASDIPVIQVGTNTYIFNWLGMDKFGVPLDALPPDSVVINEPLSFYKEYFWLIWIGAGIIIVLSFLVFVLSSTVLKLRQTREKLTLSEQNFRSIVDNATEGIFQTSLEGELLSANKAFAKIYGYDSVEEAISSISNVKTDLYIDSVVRKEFVEEVQKKGRAKDFQVKMKKRDGNHLWISMNSRMAKTAEGKPFIEGTVVDITQRKNAEIELVRMRKYLFNIIDSMPSILIGVDMDGLITLLNRTAEKNASMTSSQAQGKKVVEVFPWLEKFMKLIHKSIEEQEPRHVNKAPRHEKGETRHEDITIFPLHSDVSKEAVVRIDNVSRNVQMERMMIQSEKMMSVGGLAAGMAHEINNPLAAVIGYAHNIKKRLSGDLPKNDKIADECGIMLSVLQDYIERRGIPAMLDGISESGKRAAGIVSNMLEFSRKDEASGKEQNSATDLLDQAVKLAINVYDMQRQYDFQRIGITRQYDDNLPDVICDGNEMQQVFLNLLKNGAEAMAEKEFGEVKPHFILRAYHKRDQVIVEIEDNGPGMPEHVRRRVFEPFFTTKPVDQGTGLGLSVSYFIVTDLHKGSMEVESEEGKWTRFTIALPAT